MCESRTLHSVPAAQGLRLSSRVPSRGRSRRRSRSKKVRHGLAAQSLDHGRGPCVSPACQMALPCRGMHTGPSAVWPSPPSPSPSVVTVSDQHRHRHRYWHSQHHTSPSYQVPHVLSTCTPTPSTKRGDCRPGEAVVWTRPTSAIHNPQSNLGTASQPPDSADHRRCRGGRSTLHIAPSRYGDRHFGQGRR